jgi:uncharacterized protein (DUF1501 family)
MPLDESFAVHSCLPLLAARFRTGDALVVHAVASPYRGRSHDEARAVLAGLGRDPGASGWLNRAAAAWMAERSGAALRLLAVCEETPPEVRGPAPALVCRPESASRVGSEELARLEGALNGGGAALQVAAGPLQVAARSRRREEESAAALARLVAMPQGPRLAVLTLSGWDMHRAQSGPGGAMARRLQGLDRVLSALCEGLVPVWPDTVIAVVSEFGRTVQANEAGGTEHGLATAAFVMGGAVRGGRVVADWPGLATERLVDGGLKPTVDLRAVLKGILHDHAGIPRQTLASEIFPGSEAVPPLAGLIQ